MNTKFKDEGYNSKPTSNGKNTYFNRKANTAGSDAYKCDHGYSGTGAENIKIKINSKASHAR